MERPTMDFTSYLSHSLTQPSSASVFLGEDHSLTRVLRRLAIVQKQSLAVAVLMSGAVVGLALDESWALSTVVTAATVQAVLAFAGLLLAQHKRELVLDLIIDGHADLPVAAVSRHVRRLLEPGTRADLAARIDRVIKAALMPPRPGFLTPTLAMNAATVAPLVPELRAIARLLRTQPADTRGIALAEQLLTDGRSALYGPEVAALRQELERLRFLLCTGSAAAEMCTRR
jgi:hypothetical protein